jgi:hypothetical protein
MTVATVITPEHPAGFVVTPSHLFGLVHDNIAYSNWLNERLLTIISAQEIRAMANRLNAGTIATFPIPPVSHDEINPYTFMMSISEDNIAPLQSWARNLSAFTQSAFPSSKPLRSFTQPGNAEILRHLVFESPPPTWHSDTHGLPASGTPPSDNANPFRRSAAVQSHPSFAAAINFRQNDSPTVPVDGTSSISAVAVPATITSGQPPITSANPATPDNVPVTYGTFTTYDEFPAHIPDATIFEPVPGSDPPAHHYAVIISGKIIEIGDITSVTLPLLHPRRNLSAQNTQYFSGAIPVTNITPGFGLTPPSVNLRLITGRQLFSTPSGFTRGYPDQVNIPQLRAGNVFLGLTPAATPNASALVANAVTVPNTSNVENVTNVFLFPQSTPLRLRETIPFWSSYRFYDTRNQQWVWLPTLRHIFGTQSRSYSTPHPARRLPA